MRLRLERGALDALVDRSHDRKIAWRICGTQFRKQFVVIGVPPFEFGATCASMKPTHGLFGALIITLSFVACGGDDDDNGNAKGGSSAGGSAGKGGAAGSAGKGGAAGSAGKGGAAGSAGKGGAAGSAGKGGAAGMGGAGEGGAGGEGGEGGAAGGAGGEGPQNCDPKTPPQIFIGQLTGAMEVPANTSTATGVAIAELTDAEEELTVSVYYSGLSSNTTIGHVHGPAPVGMNADVLFDLMPTAGVTEGSVVGKKFSITPTQVGYLKTGQLYANIHSMNFMAGEIRAQLMPATVLRTGTLSGDEEVPPNDSGGTGRAQVVIMPNMTQAFVSVNWTGLTGPATIGHIHGPAPKGMNASVMLDLMPATTASGSVVHKLWQMTAEQSAALLGNMTYANIHSGMYMAGEIRAQLLPPCP
jgi:hypothetical protein